MAARSTVNVTRPTSAANEADSAAPSSAQRAALHEGNGAPAWSGRQRLARGAISLAFRTCTRVRVEGAAHLPASGPFVLAVNHLSLMDLPLVLTVLPRPATLLASGHLRRSALMDWFVSDLGRAIYIARGEGDRGALDRALEVLRAGGVLALGPEGTRSTTGGLGRGHSGVAYLATASGAPVLPLVAWGQEGLTRAWTRLRRAPIEVRIGPPLQFPRGHASAAQLREYTDQVMHALAAQLPTAYRGVYGSAAAPSPGRAGGE